MTALDQARLTSLSRQRRILILLHAATKAGIVPMDVAPFHAFAYLANVLAPVWHMPALNGKVLKRRGGPFYPTLQRDLDRMTGMGLVRIEQVAHNQDTVGRWRLEGKYSLNYDLAGDAIEYIVKQPNISRFASFATEIAYALSSIQPTDLEQALTEDATYCDPTISEDNVLDFGEWSKRNPSANAANYFDHFLPGDPKTSPGEKLHLYVSHLRRRIRAR